MRAGNVTPGTPQEIAALIEANPELKYITVSPGIFDYSNDRAGLIQYMHRVEAKINFEYQHNPRTQSLYIFTHAKSKPRPQYINETLY